MAGEERERGREGRRQATLGEGEREGKRGKEGGVGGRGRGSGKNVGGDGLTACEGESGEKARDIRVNYNSMKLSNDVK